MARIHATAIVSPEAEIGEDVEIGPYCIVDGRARLERGVRLVANVHVSGPATIGEGTEVYPFACLGYPAQDFKFKRGDPTAGIAVGRRCIIREHVTIHAATKPDAPTTIGDRVFMMATSHAGHDVRVGHGVTIMNGAALAGHAEVGEGAVLSGGTLVHQFVRIGRLAMISGGTGMSADVPPFCTLAERQRLGGVNLVGMRRAGMPREHITEVRRAFRDVFARVLPRDEMVRILEERGKLCPPVAEMARFVAESRRGICHGPMHPPRLMGAWIRAVVRGQAEAPDDDEAE